MYCNLMITQHSLKPFVKVQATKLQGCIYWIRFGSQWKFVDGSIALGTTWPCITSTEEQHLMERTAPFLQYFIARSSTTTDTNWPAFLFSFCMCDLWRGIVTISSFRGVCFEYFVALHISLGAWIRACLVVCVLNVLFVSWVGDCPWAFLLVGEP